jgi:DinB superfamily
MQINSKPEIIDAIEKNFSEVINFLNQEPNNHFIEGLEGKWTQGQHLDHLIRSAKPVILGLNVPKFIFPILFGKPNRASRTYYETLEKYKIKLAAGGKASGRFIPSKITVEEKQHLIHNFEKCKNNLKLIMAKWSDNQLDSYLLPHPLLGKITIREMLFFTILHTEHHFLAIKK